jgi:hypothetical protein
MAVLIGSSDTGSYAQTTNTYTSANGEWFYSVTASETGMADTLKIAMSSFNTTANLKLVVRNSSGVSLGSGTIAAAGGDSGTRTVAVTPFAVTAGQSYLLCILPNTGSPRPMQNTTTGTTYSQSASTYASTQSTLTLPGTLSGSVRQFHMWVEGSTNTAAIGGVNDSTDTAAYGQVCTWSTTGFSPDANAATIAGVSCSSVSSSGFTMPSLVDGATVPLPGTRQLTGTNGTQSADRNITVTAPAGMASQLLSGELDTEGAGSVLIDFDPAAVADDYILYPTAGNASVNSAGQLQTDTTGTIEMWHIKASTGIARSFQVITGAPGGIIIGLTSVGIVSRGIQVTGI